MMTPDAPSDDFLARIRARLGDRYEIARELHGGGMSRVFVAREIALDRQVVIKFLPVEIAAEANRDRFRREIQMAAKLSHPHIVPLLSAAEEGELLYFTMPFIAGESLKHSLESGHAFGIAETIDILRDVAGALAYAHRAGIVHRDIKPANILREGDHAVVTDFGVAKAVSQALALDTRASAATASGIAIGTPAYMAPEQLAGDTAADHRVDIYAFGLLGYELLTGHSPFRAPSPQALMAAQLTQPPPPLLEARPDVPPALAALLTRCLEKDAAHRPSNAESLVDALRAVATTSGSTYVASAPLNATRMRQRLVIAGALVAAGLIWFVAARASPPAPVAAPPRAESLATKPPVPLAPDVAAFTLAERESLRVLSAQIARKEQRVLGLLKDSISNAIHRSVADSIEQAKQLELATLRVQDSLMRVSRGGMAFRQGRGSGPTDIAIRHLSPRDFAGMTAVMRDSLSRGANAIAMTLPSRPGFSPEVFSMRASTLGPPRRIGVSVFSGLRNAPTVAAANDLRDSVLSRLRMRRRYVAIPVDSVAGAFTRIRSLDSLRTWLNADMWATINLSMPPGADSASWVVTLRDFTADAAYSVRSVTKRVAVANLADVSTMRLLDDIMQSLESMDRAPRKENAPPRPAAAVKPPGE